MTAPINPSVSVTVGQISEPQFWESHFDPKHKKPGSIWTDYTVINRYEHDRHTYMMGVTSPDGFQLNGRRRKAAFCRLAHPTELWIVDWTAARMREPPSVPDPRVEDTQWQLLDVHLEHHNPTAAPDGVSQLYRTSGTYFYGRVDPEDDVIKYALRTNFPRPPWLEDFFDRMISLDMFETNLKDVIRALSTGGLLGGTPPGFFTR